MPVPLAKIAGETFPLPLKFRKKVESQPHQNVKVRIRRALLFSGPLIRWYQDFQKNGVLVTVYLFLPMPLRIGHIRLSMQFKADLPLS
eukprot:02465_6